MLLALLLLAACGTRTPSQRERAAATGEAAPADTTPPPARAGVLVTRTPADRTVLNGQWRPQAGVCASPPSFQLLAQGDSVDVLLLVNLPRDTVATGTYAVQAPQDTAAPGRTARIGVQELRYGQMAYQGIRGTVQLERLDQLAAGRFDVTLQETPSHREVRYLGVFDAVPVETLGVAPCRLAQPDTLLPAIRRRPA
jgi:hypothetical protein